jgi:hypothetical protein
MGLLSLPQSLADKTDAARVAFPCHNRTMQFTRDDVGRFAHLSRAIHPLHADLALDKETFAQWI